MKNVSVIDLYILLVCCFTMENILKNSNILYQKKLRYEHHLINYENSISLDNIPYGLRVEKKALITPVSDGFNLKWNDILRNTERSLVTLLKEETETIIKYLDGKFRYSLPGDSGVERKRNKDEIIINNQNFKAKLKHTRERKWKKFASNTKKNKVK